MLMSKAYSQLFNYLTQRLKVATATTLSKMLCLMVCAFVTF